jgi:hypothetical protein
VSAHTGPTDIPGALADVHTAYLQWFGDDYDLGVLNAVLCTAAARCLSGDPPWLLVVGGSGAAKTETIAPLAAAGAVTVSTISGEAALLSGTPAKSRAKKATGGLLRTIGSSGLLVVKDFTSILSMNRDTRALVLAALREIYDGHWSRNVGTDGGATLTWHGRVVLVGACTTAWDSAYQVVSTMGDRFALARLRSDDGHRRQAGLQAMENVGEERSMRSGLAEVTRKLLEAAAARLDTEPEPGLTRAEMESLLGLADLVTRARTPVERDYQGSPAFAHALEMPTRFAKQLVQLARGGLLLGLDHDTALGVAARCCHDTMPPLRRIVLADVASHPDSFTPDVAERVQIPRSTVDRTLQELQLLGLLEVQHVAYGERVRWLYSLAPGTDRDALGKCTRNVSRPRVGGDGEVPPDDW